MGSLGGIMKMMPGMGNVQVGEKEEKKLKHTEALIQSMTTQERRNPMLMNGSRRSRISRGAGLPVKDLNALIKQFQQMKKMMKMMSGGKGKKMMKKMKKAGMDMPGGGEMPDLGGGDFPKLPNF
jgi:signal recognition particle subunit SRP54